MATPDNYTIKLPLTRGINETSPTLVLPTSPVRHREHVECFARYFLREMHFDSIQFDATETPSSPGFVRYEAHLFHNGDYFVGSSCFRWIEWKDAPPSWSLDWVWIHPFVRRRGHFAKAWPQFEQKYGRFHLARPFSCGIEIFLRKIGWLDT